MTQLIGTVHPESADPTIQRRMIAAARAAALGTLSESAKDRADNNVYYLENLSASNFAHEPKGSPRFDSDYWTRLAKSHRHPR